MAHQWTPDVLGPDFQRTDLPLTPDEEGEVVATLVRHRPPGTGEETAPPPADRSRRPLVRAVLYVHGWSDYFFQSWVAQFFTSRGIRFYAVDLRKYGRSLREGQTPGYIDDLEVYDEDLDAALMAVGEDLASLQLRGDLGIFAHSTGGLIASLWADRNPGRVAALMLNSPWLETQGSVIVRDAALPVVDTLARRHPKSELPNVDLGFSYRTTSARAEGEWTYDEVWRPPVCFPVRPGWLKAILNGHAAVARGLHVEAPILSMTSARSMIQALWSPEMHGADVVIDADVVSRRALGVGQVVTTVRLTGALHDVMLSAEPVRRRALAELDRWIGGYWPAA